MFLSFAPKTESFRSKHTKTCVKFVKHSISNTAHMTKPNCILQLEHSLGLELQDLAQIPAQRAIIDWQAMINAYAAEQENEVDAFWWPTALQRIQMSVCKNTFLQDEEGRVVGLNLYEGGLLDFSFENLEEWCHLRVLALAGNNIAFLQIPKELKHLECLDLSDNPSLDTIDLKGDFPNLTTLEFSDSGLKKLRLPTGLKLLKKLDCSRCQLQELIFEEDCPALDWLDLSQNKLKQLIFPLGFQSLTHLYLAKNPDLKKLEITEALLSLEVLNVDQCDLEELPMDSILSPDFITLYANGIFPKNIPHVFLSKENSKNCVEKARLWFREIKNSGPNVQRNNQVKLMLLGNGSAGKSSLLCAFENGKCQCDPPHKSTHGMEMKTLSKGDLVYNVWDFGGQEIYHNTHRLFLESPAVQLILFDPKIEESYRAGIRRPDRETGEPVPDQPIAYWYETARELSAKSQFLLVQNKLDESPLEDALARKFALGQQMELVQTSAHTGQKVNYIEFIIGDLAKKLPDYHMLVSASWLAVRDHLAENLKKVDPERTVSKSDFYALCQQKGVLPETQDLLLEYLHHSGFVYTNKYLKEEIIVDQKWALEAIYKLFKRDAPYYQDFRRQSNGQISVYRIFEIFGDAYTVQQKLLFLSFMESCGICFKLNTPESSQEIAETDVYVFSEFLPLKPNEATEKNWNAKAENVYSFKQTRPWINSYFIAAFIAQFGRKTDVGKIWRNGIILEPEEGWIKVEIVDTPEKAILISIEQKAIAVWLKPILEKLHLDRENQWTLSRGAGLPFQTFDLTQLEKESFLSEFTGFSEAKRAPTGGDTARMEEKTQESNIRRVMYFSANPESTGKLSIGNEYLFIHEEIDRSTIQVIQYEFHPRSNCTFKMFVDEVIAKRPHFLHFAGHGDESEIKNGITELIFQGDFVHDQDKVGASKLHKAFKLFFEKKCPLKLVLLNACLSAQQAEAISETGLLVIGSEDKISSKNARQFAGYFYSKYGEEEDALAAAKYAFIYIDEEAEECLKLFQNGEEINLK